MTLWFLRELRAFRGDSPKDFIKCKEFTTKTLSVERRYAGTKEVTEL